VGPRSVCTRLPSSHHCHASERSGCLFESSVEYETLLWVVGNSIVEPHATGRIVLLYGKGNNWNSTLLKEMTDIIGLSMSAVDVARSVLSKKHSVPPDVVSDLAGCRIANCGDVDLNFANLNLHVCKMLTGGDMLAGKITDHAVSGAIMSRIRIGYNIPVHLVVHANNMLQSMLKIHIDEFLTVPLSQGLLHNHVRQAHGC
jgi:hypothetical protein